MEYRSWSDGVVCVLHKNQKCPWCYVGVQSELLQQKGLPEEFLKMTSIWESCSASVFSYLDSTRDGLGLGALQCSCNYLSAS